jgi:hypothetical protein
LVFKARPGDSVTSRPDPRTLLDVHGVNACAYPMRQIRSDFPKALAAVNARDTGVIDRQPACLSYRLVFMR